jgi:hypothetical protein
MQAYTVEINQKIMELLIVIILTEKPVGLRYYSPQ